MGVLECRVCTNLFRHMKEYSQPTPDAREKSRILDRIVWKDQLNGVGPRDLQHTDVLPTAIDPTHLHFSPRAAVNVR
jgi:hypothetical protein